MVGGKAASYTPDQISTGLQKAYGDIGRPELFKSANRGQTTVYINDGLTPIFTLKQNPGIKAVFEFPNQEAADRATDILIEQNIRNITVRVAP